MQDRQTTLVPSTPFLSEAAWLPLRRQLLGQHTSIARPSSCSATWTHALGGREAVGERVSDASNRGDPLGARLLWHNERQQSLSCPSSSAPSVLLLDATSTVQESCMGHALFMHFSSVLHALTSVSPALNTHFSCRICAAFMQVNSLLFRGKRSRFRTLARAGQGRSKMLEDRSPARRVFRYRSHACYQRISRPCTQSIE